MRKYVTALVLSAAMCLVLAATGSAAVKYMTFGAPPATSSYYPYWVALAKAVQQVNPDYRVNVSEASGAVDIAKKVRSGMFPMGNSQSNSDYENYNGVGIFEGHAFKDARILWYFDECPLMFIALEAEHLDKMSDFNGKRLNPGTTGGATPLMTKQVMNSLGIKPDYFEAGSASAADAVSNRQIVGTVKAAQSSGADSYFLQIQANVPVTLISMTPEEQRIVHEKTPYLFPATIPGGTYKGIDDDILTVKACMGATTTSKLSQEDGYNIVRAMDSAEGRKIWEAAFPSGAKQDFVKLTLDSSVPLHAGTVQYLKEKGVDVPKNLIPEEYKEK